MDDHFTITIHDDKGIKQFNVHNLLKRFMWYGILLVSLILFVGMGASLYLYSNIATIQKSYSDIKEKNNKLQNHMDEIEVKLEEKKMQLSVKEKHFNELSSSLSEIETLIGISSETNATIDERVNVAKLNSEHMATLMQFIPSGRPLIYKGVTSGYGYRIHPLLKTREFHSGIDYRAKQGTPIYATADGIIEWAGFHEKSGYGNLVILRHAYGFKSYYGHLKKIKVKYNQFVKKGDLIALSGNTGRSSGPHLHYELKFLYKTINPTYFVRWSVDNYREIFHKEKSIPWSSLLENAQHIKVLRPTKIMPLSRKEYKELEKKKI